MALEAGLFCWRQDLEDAPGHSVAASELCGIDRCETSGGEGGNGCDDVSPPFQADHRAEPDPVPEAVETTRSEEASGLQRPFRLGCGVRSWLREPVAVQPRVLQTLRRVPCTRCVESQTRNERRTKGLVR